MKLHRKRMALSAKRVGQTCATLATTKGLEERRTYQPLVRLPLCSTSMWTEDDIERNITSSDVEFLEGEDLKKKGNAKTSRKIKDKPQSTRASIDNARHVLATPDLSGLKRKADDDDDMNDIMSVLDQIDQISTFTRNLLTLPHTAPKRESLFL
jgi:hypothetical protein